MVGREQLGKDGPLALRARSLTHAYANGVSAAFAARLGVSHQRWSNVENGRSLGIDLAHKIIAKIPGLSLDWLYRGERAGLSVEADRKLQASMEVILATSGGSAKRKKRQGR